MKPRFKAVYKNELLPVWAMEWAIADNEWTIDSITIIPFRSWVPISVAIEDVVLLQSTGLYLRDTEVFEGDNLTDGETEGTVVWHTGHFFFSSEGILRDLSTVLGQGQFELAGNAYLRG
jgi:hypothetical protein